MRRHFFGGFIAFQEQFSSATANVEASGWAILVWQLSWRHLV
ncbi:MAG: Fe-Mn family superoxide dismutase [Desulfotomaculaceae bacterium]|nr:Fe-Mn family superoxide dismutase [Desulfotomaculaceae bacterium]